MMTETQNFNLKKANILMVDDKSANLFALEKVLKNTEANLLSATNGNDALKIMVENEISLALLDIQMPNMDGYELAEIMRSNAETAEIPIIFISAIYTDKVHIFKGLELGAFSFITKPFDPKELLTKVDFFIERYQTQKHLQTTLSELQTRNTELKNFVYLTSHDLQEPMLTVTSFLKLIKEDPKNNLNNDNKEYLNYCLTASKRMQQMITSLLEYLRIGQDSPKTVIDLNVLVNEVINELQGSIKNNEVNVNFSYLPSLKVNRDEFKHLFQNFISNAIKFRKPQTTPIINIRAREEGDFWLFEIEDNGIGIDNKQHEKVFQMFKQLHNRGEYEGMGIGLSICKKIINKYGGDISVDSEVGKGTIFSFRINKVNDASTIYLQ